MLGADYSTARPGGAALKAARVHGVGRYVGTDSRCITKAEYDDLTAHGIQVWLVRETQASSLNPSMLSGRAFGISEAKAAQAALNALGVPDAPVFWAADFDIPAGSSRCAAADQYVAGWNTVIAKGRRGGYGGLWYLKHVHDSGLVDFLWECASTSFRHGVTPGQVPLHIQQTTSAPPVPGTDHNNILQTTYGQIGSEADMPATDEIIAAMKADKGLLNAIAQQFLTFPLLNNTTTVVELIEQAAGNATIAAQQKPTVVVSQADLAAAMAKLNITVDPAKFAAALAPHLGITVVAK